MYGSMAQKWLETYAAREPESQMRDVVIADLLSPFRADRWFFSLLQLSERLAATVAATCLEDATQWQIGWALAIEAAAMLAEIYANPFADKVQKRYNLLWRLLALGIVAHGLQHGLEAAGQQVDQRDVGDLRPLEAAHAHPHRDLSRRGAAPGIAVAVQVRVLRVVEAHRVEVGGVRSVDGQAPGDALVEANEGVGNRKAAP